MPGVFKVIINDKEIRVLEKDMLRYVNMEIPRLTVRQALLGAKFARSIAPKQSKKLWQGIDMKRGSGKGEASVVSRTPNTPRRRPYHYYLNLGQRGWAEGMRKSGEHRYMKATFEHLKGRFFKSIINGLDKTLRKR